jgi:O-antigen/teichoic acid export membrane protein
VNSIALPKARYPRTRQADPDATVRKRIGWIWGLMFLNVLSYAPQPLVLKIPSFAGKGITQASLWVALLLALTINPKIRLRPNPYLVIFTILAVYSLIISIATLHPGSAYRGVRLMGFVSTLWLLTPWFARRDLLLARCHLRCVVTVVLLSLAGILLGPHKAMVDHRLEGAIWPIPSTQLAHYAAVAGGLAAVLWLVGMMKRNTALALVFLSFLTIMLSHTRTALVAMSIAVLIAGLSLFLRQRRARKSLSVAVIVVTVGAFCFLPFASNWFHRGESGSGFTDLTGRTLVWHRLLNQPRSEAEVLFGAGLSNKSYQGLPIDDSWLAAYQDQGLVGDVLIGIFILALLLSAVKAPPGRARALALFLIAYGLIASYTEVGLGDASPYLLEMTLAAALLTVREVPDRSTPRSSRARAGPGLLARTAARASSGAQLVTHKVFARAGLSQKAASRAGMTMIDQCFASGSNFLVGVAVARIAGPVGLGAFSLAYGCWILINTVHRALITDPMAIFRDLNEREFPKHIKRGFAAEVVLGLAASVLFALIGVVLRAVGMTGFGDGMLALAPWVIFLDLQDYWRWVGFMEGKPIKALYNDVVFCVAQLFAFAFVFVAGMHSVYAVVAAWGVGSLAGAAYGLSQFSVGPSLKGGYQLLRDRWAMSKWNAGGQMTGWGSSQLYLILTGGLLGPAALGGLKAANNLVTGPSFVVIHAGGSFGLPEASKGLKERGWPGLRRVARLINLVSLLSIGVFGLIVIFWGVPLLRGVYGEQFVRYAQAARIMAVAYIISAFFMGPILVLKATKRTRPLFTVQVVALVSSVAAVVVCSRLYGVNGAAGALLLSNLAILGALLVYQQAARRSILHGEPIEPDGDPPVMTAGVGPAGGGRAGAAPADPDST